MSENTIGIGRAAGEIAGTLISCIADKTGKGGKDTAGKEPAATLPSSSENLPGIEGAGKNTGVMEKIASLAEKVFMPLITTMMENASALMKSTYSVLMTGQGSLKCWKV